MGSASVKAVAQKPFCEASTEWLGPRFRLCDSWLHDRSIRQGLKQQQMKAWAGQQIVRDAHAFTQEHALGLALCRVLGADMKHRPLGAHSLTGGTDRIRNVRVVW